MNFIVFCDCILKMSLLVFLGQNVVVIHEDEIDEILSDDLSDWTNLETMRSCHPMYFAKKMEEVHKMHICLFYIEALYVHVQSLAAQVSLLLFFSVYIK